MKKTKFTALALGLILGVTTLSGCSEEAETSVEYVDVGALQNASLPEITAVNLEPGDSSGANSDNSSKVQSSESSGGTSSGESSAASSAPAENKSAEIVIPKTTEYGVYIAEFSEFDPEKVKTALWGDVPVTPEIRDHHDDYNNVDYKVYDWEKDDILLHVNGYSPYIDMNSELSYVVNLIFREPDRNHDGNIEAYKRLNEPLDFCTPEQAVNDIRGKLAQCGINVSADAEVYALHQDEMQRTVDEMCAEGHFRDPKSSMKDPDAKPLTSYPIEKSDECYYIVFNQEFGGVPVYNYNFSYNTIKDLTIFHPEIKAVYSSDGLVGLMMNKYRGNITETEKVTQLISPESAAQAVTAKYSDMGASKVEFDKVELMYVLTPNIINGKTNVLKAKLTPAWVCTVYYTIWRKDKRSDGSIGEGYVTRKEIILIDAVTGAEII